jgi:hypothetical protein
MNKITLTVAMVLLVGFANSLRCQEEAKKRTVGISASLQNNVYGINIPIWLSQKFVLAPTLGVNYAGNVGTDYTIGIMPKIYLKEANKLASFIDIKLAGIFNSPQSSFDKNSKTDLVVGIGFGGEYFFNDNFSVGAEFQGNLTSSDSNSNRFGNPGNVNFNLATAVTVNVYFAK